MSEITMSCNRCGASITTRNVAEAVQWNVSHDEVCPVSTTTEGKKS